MAEICDLFETGANMAAGMPSSVILPAAVIQDAAVATDGVLLGLTALFTDTASSADTITDSRGTLVSEHFNAATTIMQTGVIRSLVLERAKMAATSFAVLSDAVEASGVFSDAVMQNQILQRVRDSAVATGTATGTLTLTQLVIAAAIIAKSSLTSERTDLVSDAALALGQALQKLAAVDRASATAAATEAVTAAAYCTDLASASARFIPSTSDQLVGYSLAEARAYAQAQIVAAGNQQAWTAPTDSFAMSRYELPLFNSITAAPGKVMLASDSGLYVRGGMDDAGAPIVGYVQTGMDDFGNEYLKRVDHLYTGYTSGGSMKVDVGETSTGAEVVYTFTMPAHPATAPTAGRTKLGRGLRSRYYRFTFGNTDGEPLGLFDASVDTLNTSRKY